MAGLGLASSQKSKISGLKTEALIDGKNSIIRSHLEVFSDGFFRSLRLMFFLLVSVIFPARPWYFRRYSRLASRFSMLPPVGLCHVTDAEIFFLYECVKG